MGHSVHSRPCQGEIGFEKTFFQQKLRARQPPVQPCCGDDTADSFTVFLVKFSKAHMSVMGQKQPSSPIAVYVCIQGVKQTILDVKQTSVIACPLCGVNRLFQAASFDGSF